MKNYDLPETLTLPARVLAAYRAENPDAPVDKRQYAVRLCRAVCTDKNILGPHGAVLDDGQRYTVEGAFDAMDVRIIRALHERYGDAVIATVRGSTMGYPTLHVFHTDVLGNDIPEEVFEGLNGGFLDDIHIGGWHPFRIVGIGSFGMGIAHRLLRAEHPDLEALVWEALTPVQREGGIQTIPVLPALRGRAFEDCPTFGEAIHYADPDLLLGEGVVVDLDIVGRVRIWLNWDRIAEDGWQKGRAQDLSLRVQRTTDPVTPTGGPSKSDFHYLTVRGVGRTRQVPNALPILGRRPYCLMHFQAGTDFTWNFMVTLDEGEIRVGWLEATCT